MRKVHLRSVIVISFYSILITIQAQVPTKKDVKLTELIRKSSAEIDQILGKPKRIRDINDTRGYPPIIADATPDKVRFYKLQDSLNIVVYFYDDEPVAFDIGYSSQRKQPDNVEEALSRFGIDEKGRFLTEDKVDPLTYSSGAKRRVQSWEGYIGKVKCQKIEVIVFDSEWFQVLKGNQSKRQIKAITIALPAAK